MTKCENCEDTSLKDRIKVLEERLKKYEDPKTSKIVSVKKPLRLRSLGTQTTFEGSSEFVNPFFTEEEEDDTGYERPPTLGLQTLRPNSGGNVNTGGTIKNVKKTSKSAAAPDCFKPETVGIHSNKGGDGFEAWKGNRKVIKKLKLGVKKEE